MAVESRRVDPRDLRPIADGHVDDSTREAVTALLVFQIDRENQEQFWRGFCHGVAGYLVEQHGLVERSRNS